MAIISYHFSERGITHIENDTPCQDHSELFSYGLWRVAVVADGVGSCKHSDEASKIAIKAALKTVYNCFPNNCKEEDLCSLITMAFHCAANAVEMHVKSIKGDYKDYHTTLALALYDGNNLYYGNSGDSGIIALDDYGEYHIVSKKQSNEYDEVITLASRSFEVGKVDYNVIAVLCMTDGILDWVIPNQHDEEEETVYVPRANLFVCPQIWEQEGEISAESANTYRDLVLTELHKITADLDAASKNPRFLERFGNFSDGNLKDDLSVALLLNSNADMSEDQIAWTPPAAPTIEDVYCKKWKEILALHPSVADKEFRSFVQRNNTSWNAEDIDHYVTHIQELCLAPKTKPVSTTVAVDEDIKFSVSGEEKPVSVASESPQMQKMTSVQGTLPVKETPPVQETSTVQETSPVQETPPVKETPRMLKNPESKPTKKTKGGVLNIFKSLGARSSNREDSDDTGDT